MGQPETEMTATLCQLLQSNEYLQEAIKAERNKRMELGEAAKALLPLLNIILAASEDKQYGHFSVGINANAAKMILENALDRAGLVEQ